MRLYSALKQGLHIDKLVVFMFVSLLAATLFTYFTSGGGFFVDRLDYFFIGLVRETVELNLDVFTSSPLDSGFLLEEGGRMRAPDVRFSHTYLALSHHPSWLLNSVLIRLMIIGRFNVLMAGIVIAAYVYRTDPLRFGNATAWCLMKWQVLTAVLSVVVLIGVTAVLGTAMGLVMYQQISGHEGMVFVRELYNETDGLWRPDAAYYARALTLTFIHLTSYTFVGIFIGHAVKNSVAAIVGSLYIVNYFGALLYSCPILPLYFLPRISGFFIASAAGFPLVVSGGLLPVDLALLLLSSAALIFVSAKLMSARGLQPNRP